MFQKLEELGRKLEGMSPHIQRVVSVADVYACLIINHLQAIEDAVTGEGEYEIPLQRPVALTNGVAKTIDIPNNEDWEVQAIVAQTPSAGTTILLTQNGVVKFAKNTAVADSWFVGKTVLLQAGAELTLLSTGGDITLTLLAVTRKRRPPRVALVPGMEAHEIIRGGSQVTDPDRGFPDEAVHIAPTDADDLGLPLPDGLPRKVPSEHYEG